MDRADKVATASRERQGSPKGGRRKVGRPKGSSPVYDDAKRDEIIALLETGATLRSICLRPGFPCFKTVLDWAEESMGDAAGFGQRFARAREIGYRVQGDEIVDIADDTSGDWTERNGQERPNGEVVARSRLRIDARKWVLSKMLPHVYGDKVGVELTGAGGGAIQIEDMGLSELARRLAFVINQGVIDLPGAAPVIEDHRTIDAEALDCNGSEPD